MHLECIKNRHDEESWSNTITTALIRRVSASSSVPPPPVGEDADSEGDAAICGDI